MRIGVADYGMTQWYGGCFDVGERLDALHGIGYEGIERLEAASPAEAIAKAVRFRERGMDFTTCRAPSIEATIQWTAALGKAYVWTQVLARDFDGFCRQANEQARVAKRFGVRVGLHNHLGTPVESPEQLDEFLLRCPEIGLVFDTGHHAAAGGDPLDIIRRHLDRILTIHVKDWFVTDPAVGLDRWPQRGRFTGLGQGSIGQDNAAVVRAAVAGGYDGWVFVEHDTHLQDPLIDLAASRAYLRAAGV